MKKPFAAYINRIYAVLLIAMLFVFCVPLTAFAAETTITTTVPSEFPLKIEIEGSGTVEFAGKRYNKSTELMLLRHRDYSFKIMPDRDYEITSVLYNGEDILSEIVDGTFVISQIEGDSVLHISFERNSKPAVNNCRFIGFLLNIIHCIFSKFR